MKYPNRKKHSSRPKRPSKRTTPTADDRFFEPDQKRQRRRRGFHDEDIDSQSDEDEGRRQGSDREGDEEREEEAVETAAEVKLRIAREHLESIRAARDKIAEEEGEEEEDGEEREEKEGRRDSLIAAMLQKSQMEESGRMRRLFAAR